MPRYALFYPSYSAIIVLPVLPFGRCYAEMQFETLAEIMRVVDAYHHGYLGYAVHAGIYKFRSAPHAECLYKLIWAETCKCLYLLEVYRTAHVQL